MQVNRIAIARDLPSFDVAVEQRLDARGKSSVIVVHAGLTPEARAGSSHGRSGKSTIQSLCPFSGLCFWEFLAGRCAWMRYSACLIATNNSSIDGQPMDDDNDLKHSAVDKALVLLKLLGDFASHGEVRLVDVVKASGYQRPTVHRLLATLKNHGFVGLELRNRALQAGLKTRTPHTIIDPTEFDAELARIVARGYAIDDQENEPEVRCVAAPIFNAAGRAVAGMSVSGTTSQVTSQLVLKFGEDVRAACLNVSEKVGFRVRKSRAAQ